MQKITLEKMTLINFKGIRNLSLSFNDVTTIKGDNGTGKTTIVDAFMWLLFGKDSSDKKDFSIKTKDKNGITIPKLEHEVNASININGQSITLRRIYKEKWVKKRGSEIAEMQGNVQEYFYNDVPLSESEYKLKISTLINEDLFKLITNPYIFNAKKWQEKREILFNIAGAFDEQKLINNNDDYAKLFSENLQPTNKTIDEFKKELSAKKKKINEQITAIPTRIDEAERNKPQEVDELEIQATINSLSKQINEIDLLLLDAGKAQQKEFEKQKIKQQEKHKLEMQLQSLIHEDAKKQASFGKIEKDRLDAVKERINECNYILQKNKEVTENYLEKNEYINNTLSKMREEWAKENAKEAQLDIGTKCPTCNQSLPAELIESNKTEIINNFNADKALRLENLKERADSFKKTLIENTQGLNFIAEKSLTIKTELEALEIEQKELKKTIETLPTDFESNPEIEIIKKQIANIIIEVVPDTTEGETLRQLKNKKDAQKQIDAAKELLNNNKQIATINERIAELTAFEKELVKQLSDLERLEFIIQQFTKDKITAIEAKINDMFHLVKFKLFETQINGGEIECCECTVNGVPYPDVNTAGKINAGIDVINTLSAHYNTIAPIFVDNKESINKVLPTNSQLILLEVSNDKILKVY